MLHPGQHFGIHFSEIGFCFMTKNFYKVLRQIRTISKFTIKIINIMISMDIETTFYEYLKGFLIMKSTFVSSLSNP